ncbi:MAG: S8 family serine peptidase [Candidatus Thorarchaeota archaeon]
MDYYWQTTSSKESKTDGTKIIAAIIILMIVISTGLVFVFQVGPFGRSGNNSPVRVAVLDSGINQDFTLQGRVVAEKSFIETQYGYDVTDLAVTDSEPENVPHGTLVAKLVAETYNALIVNGKVLSSDGTATSIALVEAIYWAVEQNCSVISMSLGADPVFGDPLEAAVDWAFSQGVVVVSSAGNEGEGGLIGTSISSPSLYDRCISVAAAYENGEPTEFSSTGPTHERFIKPDITANGWATDSGGRYYGTSFASPRVAGAAADLIGYCEANNITYTAGTIITALLKGATPMDEYPSYVVGTGLLNVQNSLNLIIENSEEGELPAVSLAFPSTLPLDYERIFLGDTYVFYIRLFTSGYTTFDVSVDSATPEIFDIPSTLEVNQTFLFPLTIEIPSTGLSVVSATIQFSSSEFGDTELQMSFDVANPIARVAFDISHSTWSIDSYYGQFREFYKDLAANDISVTEIRNSSATTPSFLQEFDSVVILDPCVYDLNETNPYDPTYYSLPFSNNEKQAYQDYFDSGGGIFLVGLSSETTNVTQVNDFLSWSGFSLTNLEVPSGSSPELVDNLDSHIITSGVSGFHYLGATIQIPTDGHRLARYGGMPILGYKEGGGGGKIVVTGSNYFVDNYAFLGEYGAGDDALIALRIVAWTAGVL